MAFYALSRARDVLDLCGVLSGHAILTEPVFARLCDSVRVISFPECTGLVTSSPVYFRKHLLGPAHPVSHGNWNGIYPGKAVACCSKLALFQQLLLSLVLERDDFSANFVAP